MHGQIIQRVAYYQLDYCYDRVVDLRKVETEEAKIFDVAGAYLNAELKPEERQYMRLSKEIEAIVVEADPSKKLCLLSDGSMVVELRKALYGLKNSARKWYEMLAKKLMAAGYQQCSEIDKCLLYKMTGGKIMYV